MAEQSNGLSNTQIDAYYKHNAAVHEAGHVTVAAAKGLRTWAWLYRSDPREPEARWWLGRTQVVGDDSACAVAGMVADNLGVMSEIDVSEIIEEWQERGDTDVGLSPTDMELVPESWPARAALVKEALTILRDQKPLFDRIVSELVENECVDSEMISDWSMESCVEDKPKPRSRSSPKK